MRVRPASIIVALLSTLALACRKEPAPKLDAGATTRDCRGDADCKSGSKCYFEDPGCGVPGQCLSVPPTTHTCTVAVPMCSCTRHETFFGGGGCPGQGVFEPWELYACTCTTDADCRAGQRCVPIPPFQPLRPDATAATRECRAPLR